MSEDTTEIAAQSIALLDSLPKESVVMDGDNQVWRKRTRGWDCLDLDGSQPMEDARTVAWQSSVPRVRVLWRPDAEVRASVVSEEPEWEYAPAFEEDPVLAVALINRDVAQREVDGWNQARRRTLAREGRDIGKSILVHRRKAGPWLPASPLEGQEEE